MVNLGFSQNLQNNEKYVNQKEKGDGPERKLEPSPFSLFYNSLLLILAYFFNFS